MKSNSLTTEEAKGRVCPIMREEVKEGSGRYWQATCKADECMAWQWEMTGWDDARGYCGLARGKEGLK